MLSRKLKLNWRYALSELAIVTVGILIALAIDQWNDDRNRRADELETLSRLIDDIALDLTDLGFRLEAIDRKEESLNRVAAQLDSAEAANSYQFLTDVVIGANYGWNQGRANRATYDDLIGSGRLGIIREPRIRLDIAH